MDRLISQNTDGMIIILGRLVDPMSLIQLIYGICQISIYKTRLLSQTSDHTLQRLSGLHHNKIVIFTDDQALRFLHPLLDLLPAGSTFKV